MIRRFALPTLLATLLAACATIITTNDHEGTTPMTPPSTQAAEILKLVNAARAAGATCPTDAEHTQAYFAPTGPLVLEARLTAAAQQHSEDMANRSYFAHVTPDGVTLEQRIVDQQGYRSWKAIGENIAAGYGTAQANMTAWLNSPSHCPHIMDPTYRELGVGYINKPGSRYGDYWTQNFGARH